MVLLGLLNSKMTLLIKGVGLSKIVIKCILDTRSFFILALGSLNTYPRPALKPTSYSTPYELAEISQSLVGSALNFAL